MSCLVLLDLDKTVVSVSGDTTSSVLPQIVRACAQQGITVGIASDSSLAKIEYWYGMLACNGPVIAERGAILIRTPGGPVEELLPGASGYFLELRARFLDRMRTEFPETVLLVGEPFHSVDLRICDGLATRFVRINGSRRCSFSCVTRLLHEGRLILDADVLARYERVVSELCAAPSPPFSVYHDVNPEYGSIIIGADEATKTHAVRWLCEPELPDRIIMIGNSMHDMIHAPRVEQWAVGNADPDYAARCSRVAVATLTDGVAELLRELVSSSVP